MSKLNLEELFYLNPENFNGGNRKVLLHCESLVGAGHIGTLHSLGHSLLEESMDVTIVTGSRIAKAPHLDFGKIDVIDLPESKGNFYSGLVKTSNGMLLEHDKDWQEDYKRKLLKAFYDVQPDVVVTEFWPIRRGCFDFAMIPLMEEIQMDRGNRQIDLYCLLRDYVHMSVSNTASGGTDKESIKVLEEFYFDSNRRPSVIVRGIEDILPLEDSFPLAKKIKNEIEYVGYFVPDANDQGDLGKGEVMVTSGGGYMDYCYETSSAVIQAIEHTSLSQNTWRILMPHDTPEDIFGRLREEASKTPVGDNIIIENNIDDFRDRLPNAELLVCHAGDTIAEAVKAGVPTVALPRIKLGDCTVLNDGRFVALSSQFPNEQFARAMAFANYGLVNMARPEDIGDVSCFSGIIDNAVSSLRISINSELEECLSGNKTFASMINREAKYSSMAQYEYTNPKYSKLGDFEI